MGFNSGWFSHKFNKAGVRYEMATCIVTGNIVWIHGPFPCGSFPDLKIFRLGIKHVLRRGERVWADKGYRGERVVLTPLTAISQEHKREMDVARARHETINGRFTDYGSLNQVWRHDRAKHHLAYESIAVITQLEISNGYPPFQCTAQHNPIVY
jgi:hypothetical protein